MITYPTTDKHRFIRMDLLYTVVLVVLAFSLHLNAEENPEGVTETPMADLPNIEADKTAKQTPEELRQLELQKAEEAAKEWRPLYDQLVTASMKDINGFCDDAKRNISLYQQEEQRQPLIGEEFLKLLEKQSLQTEAAPKKPESEIVLRAQTMLAEAMNLATPEAKKLLQQSPINELRNNKTVADNEANASYATEYKRTTPSPNATSYHKKPRADAPKRPTRRPSPNAQKARPQTPQNRRIRRPVPTNPRNRKPAPKRKAPPWWLRRKSSSSLSKPITNHAIAENHTTITAGKNTVHSKMSLPQNATKWLAVLGSLATHATMAQQNGSGGFNFLSSTPSAIRVTAEGGSIYDQTNRLMIFVKDVVVEHPGFTLKCPKLELFLNESAQDTQGIDGEQKDDEATAAPEQNEASNTQSAIRKAVASGGLVTIQRKNPKGQNQIGKAQRVIYDAKSGEITMREYPQIQMGNKLIISTDRKTVFIIKPTGELIVEGPAVNQIVAD